MSTAKPSKLDIIREVLHEQYLAEDQGWIVEEHIGKGGKPVPPMKRQILSTHSIRYLLYRFANEGRQEILPFFAHSSGLKKLCDYILFAQDGKNCYCLLIEMKEGSGGTKQQLKATAAFVEYIINAAARVGKMIACTDVHIRLISVHERGKKKAGEREDDPEYSDQWLKLTADKLRLTQLLK